MSGFDSTAIGLTDSSITGGTSDTERTEREERAELGAEEVEETEAETERLEGSNSLADSAIGASAMVAGSGTAGTAAASVTAGFFRMMEILRTPGLEAEGETGGWGESGG